ncbi:MAG TPA: sugar ABC transporter permease, partial [Lachnospiraceae bacterium]|nr:sugar ABC transporter permease [Lachnospiraceae bacterium]
YIDFPSILPTATILLILNCGNILSIGFEKVFLLQNDLNLSVSQVISTYTYQVGLIDNNISYSTAIGLFNSVINAILLITVNKASNKLSGVSLW